MTKESETRTMAEKMGSWSNLTKQLMKTLFGEIYATRIVNLVSKVQFS